VNFIEKYFGISPDGGDSSLEIMVLVLPFDRRFFWFFRQ
jgi:hypothetical protein